jgi:hypothetical protein
MNLNEKSASADVETANSDNGDILTPLLLLLAAHRGFQHDSSVTQLRVPDDYVINYRGKSGVKAINHTPWLIRLICALGYKPVMLKYALSQL